MENGRLIALGTPAELVRQMHKSLQMEIEVDENGREAAVNVITQMDGMQTQVCENGTLTITGIEREQIPEMLTGLVEAGVRIYRANPQEPSLTDVYFTLHKENQS
jgi:ABC-2 type transport system ATP-binding protein